MINQAFGPNGLLTDTTAAKGEQDGARAMFAGAYAGLRNPSGHRDVDYDDVAEAAEAVAASRGTTDPGASAPNPLDRPHRSAR